MPPRTPKVKIVCVAEGDYNSYLAGSTLALDLAGVSLALPDHAAKAGVPCISIARNKRQAMLWLDLTLRDSDYTAAATKLAHWMLTDQGDAAEMCAIAQNRRVEQRLGKLKKKRQYAVPLDTMWSAT